MRTAYEEPITYEMLRSLAKLGDGTVVSVFHPTLRQHFTSNRIAID